MPNKPETGRKTAFRSLLSYGRPHRKQFVLVFFLTLLAVAADLLQPYLVKVAIDDNIMAGKNDFRMLLILCGIYLLLSVSSFFFSYLMNNMLQYASQSIIARIRKDLFRHISRLSMSYFDRTPSGSLITHVSSDTESLNQFFSQVLLSLMRDGLTLIFIVAFMFHLDVELTIYCLILIPVIFLIAIGFRRHMRKTYQRARSALSRLISFAAENLAGMSLIQAFHQEKEQKSRFADRNRAYFGANLSEVGTSVLFNRSFDILGGLAIAFVIWLGGNAVFQGNVEFGVLYAFITYIRLFFQPISTITQQWNTLQSATVSANRIWSVFSLEPEVKDAPVPAVVDPKSVRGRIDFHRVHFYYEKGQPVIHDLSLSIKPGEMIGVVGATGAGKSTLIGLLCRFYDVRQGSVRIDGTDVRDIAQQQLHRLIGLVQQEPYLYSGSIVDNVRMFDESIAREEVERACRFVGADELIGKMRDGYDTRLSERGSGLSAGERQLISFARIIVFQPKILILDEATANLDSYTEQLVQNALRVVSEHRTTIVIAHRLSTIVHADRIIVMRGGKIVEEGDHAQLLQLHGYYEELVRHSRGRAGVG
ncbi:ABC transporter ATP-binding protein [Cohnella hongkongensis]|uniref:ABC transporter ATP-binding protein n=1 Tax=Cohnella hongkongensis TaxID=178337 RepID=A0ABV9FA97_9BACL